MNKSGNSIFVIGVQPLPVHGLSAMNEAVLKLLKARSADVVEIDLCAGQTHGFKFACRRMWRFVLGIARFTSHIVTSPESVTYVALSGGTAQILDLCFIIAARIQRSKIYVHHHTFAYFERRSPLFALIARAAGPGAKHIVLCEEMAAALRSVYGVNARIHVISNIGFLQIQTARLAPRTSVTEIGFLSNICRAKGIAEFFEVAELLHRKYPQIRFRIAGPIVERGLEPWFRKRLATLSGIQYVGPVYRQAKLDFLSTVDVLLFPSQLPEAEPLTIREALGSATPVIATATGCLRSVIPPGSGRVIGPEQSFAEAAVACISRWIDSPSEFHQVSGSAQTYFAALQESSEHAAERLLKEISNCGAMKKHVKAAEQRPIYEVRSEQVDQCGIQ